MLSCLALGLFLGFQLPVVLPSMFIKYWAIAILAALDSVMGGLRAYLENSFDNSVFTSGFIFNAILAGLLAYLGDRLGVELYLACILVFGMRLFDNLAEIRRYLLKKHDK